MKLLKRKQAVLMALIAMIALAGYFNWSYKNADNGAVQDSEQVALGEARLVSSYAVSESKDYFAQSRIDRDAGRSKAMDSLRSIADNKDSSEETKRDAEARMLTMSERIEQEAASEAEIKAKGFEDAVVYINDTAVTVVIKCEHELTGSDAAKIQEIVVRIAGVNPSDVSISRYE